MILLKNIRSFRFMQRQPKIWTPWHSAPRFCCGISSPLRARNWMSGFGIRCFQSKNEWFEEFNLKRVLEGMKLEMSEFVDFCILLGCDYCSTIRVRFVSFLEGIIWSKNLKFLKVLVCLFLLHNISSCISEPFEIITGQTVVVTLCKDILEKKL